MKIYTDATFDKITKRSFVGYCCESMIITKVLRRKFDNVNLAETYALRLAIKDLGDNHEYYSDSVFAVENLAKRNVHYIIRSKNLADTLVSSAKESFNSKSFRRK